MNIASLEEAADIKEHRARTASEIIPLAELSARRKEMFDGLKYKLIFKPNNKLS